MFAISWCVAPYVHNLLQLVHHNDSASICYGRSLYQSLSVTRLAVQTPERTSTASAVQPVDPTRFLY